MRIPETEKSTVRIRVEPDPHRAGKKLFTPIRQSVFWLRAGQNANTEELLQVRTPFVTHITSEGGSTAFFKGLEGVKVLYSEKFGVYTTSTNNHVILGDYSHSKLGRPVILVRNDSEGTHITHTWIPARRQSRL